MDRRTKASPGAPSLKELCQRALMANIGRIRHLGPVPQYLVAEVLAQCTVEQLEAIEHSNPHLIPDNEDLWMVHCTARYAEMRQLQLDIDQGIAPPVLSWRSQYWDMRRRDEIRAQQIMERVRSRTAEIERMRNARKIQQIPASVVARGRGGKSAAASARQPSLSKGASLMQHARMKAKAHIQMLGPSSAPRATARTQTNPSDARSPPPQPAHAPKLPTYASTSPTHVQPGRNALLYPAQLSPADSPAQSPPYYPSSYSPPYLSSGSSCSPPHSSYSPPYVPDEGSRSQSDCAPRFNIFEDIMGVSVKSASLRLSPTVTIKGQPRKEQKQRLQVASSSAEAVLSSKRRRLGTSDTLKQNGRLKESGVVPELKVRSEDLIDPAAQDFFRELSG
ncbi:Elongin-A [Coemansia guatemalensis]|uniref:Elongin-A n=1 Tax=Coemansia guatemalensis TaxID=2761395 RepID=A0A9W8HZG2_9FUNG|nr:Elongin-A [Coemansia guatemalensis]